MTSKTIFMNEGSDDGYVYSDEETEETTNQQCGGSVCSDEKYEQDCTQEQLPEFYENLEIIPESAQTQTQSQTKIKNKPRSMSIDSESSDVSKRLNFKCGSCKKSFLLDKNQKMIRCSFCGYRILFKLRTKNYISFKTE